MVPHVHSVEKMTPVNWWFGKGGETRKGLSFQGVWIINDLKLIPPLYISIICTYIYKYMCICIYIYIYLYIYIFIFIYISYSLYPLYVSSESRLKSSQALLSEWLIAGVCTHFEASWGLDLLGRPGSHPGVSGQIDGKPWILPSRDGWNVIYICIYVYIYIYMYIHEMNQKIYITWADGMELQKWQCQNAIWTHK